MRFIDIKIIIYKPRRENRVLELKSFGGFKDAKYEPFCN